MAPTVFTRLLQTAYGRLEKVSLKTRYLLKSYERCD